MYEKLFRLQEDILKSLANHKRLEILQLLNNRELTVNEMVDMLGIPQANVSQHLSVMRHLKLVTTRREGLRVYYRLTDKRLASVISELREFLKAQHGHDPDIARIATLDSADLYPIVRDPVCGMRMSVPEAGESTTHGGKTYYFCAAGCKHSFETHPEQYLVKITRGAAA